MKKRGFVMQKVCAWTGAGLLLAAILSLVFWSWNISNAQKQAENYVRTLQERMPEPQNAVPEARRDNTMAVLPVDGIDFVGIIELPGYASVLPVCADWGQISQYPCRFYGSIYDGTMQIGATSQKGQYDFYRELSLGDVVIYTDMEGKRYTFEVTALRYEKHADQAALQREPSALILFIKNWYSFEYLIVFCQVR